jgi:hypothetical protein
MMSIAGWLGLGMSLVGGVLILFCYGMSFRMQTKVATAESPIPICGYIGFVLIVLGTICLMCAMYWA